MVHLIVNMISLNLLLILLMIKKRKHKSFLLFFERLIMKKNIIILLVVTMSLNILFGSMYYKERSIHKKYFNNCFFSIKTMQIKLKNIYNVLNVDMTDSEKDYVIENLVEFDELFFLYSQSLEQIYLKESIEKSRHNIPSEITNIINANQVDKYEIVYDLLNNSIEIFNKIDNEYLLLNTLKSKINNRYQLIEKINKLFLEFEKIYNVS